MKIKAPAILYGDASTYVDSFLLVKSVWLTMIPAIAGTISPMQSSKQTMMICYEPRSDCQTFRSSSNTLVTSLMA
jgi:hypothetical protein